MEEKNPAHGLRYTRHTVFMDIIGVGNQRKRKSKLREEKDSKRKYRGGQEQWSFGANVLRKKKMKEAGDMAQR